MRLSHARAHFSVVLAALAGLSTAGIAGASDGPISISVAASHSARGSQFKISIHNASLKAISGALTWRTLSVEGPQARGKRRIRILGGERTELAVDSRLPRHGFTECQATWSDGRRSDDATATRRVISDTTGIIRPLTRPADFSNFWETALSRLARVPIDAQLKPVFNSASHMKVYEVSLHSFGNVRLGGWLELPPAGSHYGVVVRLPGYGQDMQPVGIDRDYAVLSFNPRGHGNSCQDVPGEPHDYWIRGLDSKDTYFYLGAYLDCVRAIDFVCSLPQIDQKNIVIWGGSQGGGLAFATAALDHRVGSCFADIPFLCDWPDYFKLSDWPEMTNWISADPKRSWAKTLHTLSYFDTMNLAPWIKCPVKMGSALQDPVCPPTTEFATFNRIRSPKSFEVFPEEGHAMPQSHYDKTWLAISQLMKLGE